MPATLLWLRRNMRTNRRSVLIVVLIAALCGGTAMAAAAGARRTTTAYSRFVRDSKEPQMYVAAHDRSDIESASVVMRAMAGPQDTGRAVVLDAVPTGAQTPGGIDVFGVLDRAWGTNFAFAKIVAGRTATGDDEINVNEVAARVLGLAVGDRLAMRGSSPDAAAACESGDESRCVADVDLGAVTVAGVIRTVDDLSAENNGGSSISLPPGLTERWLPRIAASQWLAGAWFGPTVDRNVVAAAVRTAVGPDRFEGENAKVFLEPDNVGDPERTAGALEIERNALLVVALLAALGGMIAVPQSLDRLHRAGSTEHEFLTALGATRRMLRSSSIMTSLVIGSAAALLAVMAAIAVSPLLPIGLARRAEPSTGFHADWTVLTAGAATTMSLIVVAALAIATWSRRHVDASTSEGVNHNLLLSRPVPGMARRLLTDRGRVSRVARTAGASAVLGVAIVAGTGVVIASQHTLVERPALFGAPWDLQGTVVADRSSSLHRLATDPRVDAAAVLHGGRLVVDGREIGAVGVETLRGSFESTVLVGRMVRGDGEIMLSRPVMRALDVGIGDVVTVENAGTTGPFTIVGTAVPIAVGLYTSDDGAIVTASDFDRFGTMSQIYGEGGVEVAVRATPGANLGTLSRDLAALSGGSVTPIATTFHPTRIVNLEGVDRALWMTVAFAAMLTALVLVHAIASLAQRGRHDLAVARAIGMRRRDARQAVMWHGLMLASVSIAVGIPLGLIAGRVVWHVVSRAAYAVNAPQLPVATIGSAVALTIGIVAAVGLLESRRVVPRALTGSMRTE